MTISDLNNVFFLGIGGIGMSALARYLNQKKVSIYGYDHVSTPLTDNLIKEGISIIFEDDVQALPKLIDLVIYTPAVPLDLKIFQHLRAQNIPIMKRSEFLGKLTSEHDCLAVAGTHGKTTTSAILGHILYHSRFGCSAFIGGIVNNYKTNYFSKNNGPFVVEADEFDYSLLRLFPKIAAINSMDADHLDIYGNQENLIKTYQQFANQIDKNGFLIVKKGLEQNFDGAAAKVFTVALRNSNADFYIKNLYIENGIYHFDIQTPTQTIEHVQFGGVGEINIHNALTATTMALCYGVEIEAIKTALQTFSGVHRRLEFQIKNDKVVLIDDYGHHPTEIKAAIESVRMLYPNRKLTVVFQPHLFSRTRDFAFDFARSLDFADECFLLDIYPARELPIEGVTSLTIAHLMKSKKVHLVSKQQLCEKVLASFPEVVLMLGAGDIDRLVQPMKKTLNTLIQ